jgi:hypothetical protein
MKKPLTKKQLVEKMGISASTLQKLLNVDWYDEIVECGYKKNLKILSPRILKKIFDIWVFEYEND